MHKGQELGSPYSLASRFFAFRSFPSGRSFTDRFA